jgi:nucleoside-diphosphate-sugar epimerase
MSEPFDALVLGASGLVGLPLCRALRDLGQRVCGAARFRDDSARRALEDIGVETVRYDALRDDPAELPDTRRLYLEIWDPGQHGGRGARSAIWELNFHAVGRVAARFADSAHIVNGCSGNVYGTGPQLRSESVPPRPDDEYGLARFAQERLLNYLARRGGRRAVHLRYYHSNAPDSGMIRRVAESVRRGESLGPAPDQRIQLIGRGDFVRCTVEAGRRVEEVPEEINICHPRVWTFRELADRCREELGTGEVVFDRPAGGEEASVLGDPARMIELFGPPREDIEQILRETCRAVREERS